MSQSAHKVHKLRPRIHSSQVVVFQCQVLSQGKVRAKARCQTTTAQHSGTLGQSENTYFLERQNMSREWTIEAATVVAAFNSSRFYGLLPNILATPAPEGNCIYSSVWYSPRCMGVISGDVFHSYAAHQQCICRGGRPRSNPSENSKRVGQIHHTSSISGRR